MHFGAKWVYKQLYKFFGVMMITASVLAMILSDISAETKPSQECLIEAAFLFNFAKFIEWPSDSFENDLSPLNLCILGTDPFDSALDTIKGKTVKGRPFKIRWTKKIHDIEGCHILFISTSEKENLKQILYGLRSSNTLTVSEIDGFAQLGGMINFIIVDQKVRFEINLDVAQRSRLKMSAQLLKLAKRVTTESKKEKK